MLPEKDMNSNTGKEIPSLSCPGGEAPVKIDLPYLSKQAQV
jgi:hypothetical protein